MQYLLEKKGIECSQVNILEIYPNETNILKYEMLVTKVHN